MTNTALFKPYALGSITLSNRVVMAPLTRNRAGAGLVPSALAAEYYAQRASAGLIITEATQVSKQAQGSRIRLGFTHRSRSRAGRRLQTRFLPRADGSSFSYGMSVASAMSIFLAVTHRSHPQRSEPRPRRL